MAKLEALHVRRNASTSECELCVRDGLVLRLHPDSVEPLKAFCYVAPEMVYELDSFIEATKDRRALLDIGALHGAFALVFAAKDSTKRAVAVDASPIAFARLLYNIHRNGASNIVPIECALSDNTGVLAMHYEWEHAVAAGTSTGQNALTVAKKTGDSLCEELPFEPDVIKIDVEGHEVKVLSGLTRIIGRLKPLIFLELHPTRIVQEGDRIEDLVSLLMRHDYSVSSTSNRPVSFDEMCAMKSDNRLVLRSALDSYAR